MQLYLNWLWQGTIITLIVACAIHPWRSMNAATRERIWWITLIAVAGIPLFHLVKLFLVSNDARAIAVAEPQPTFLTVAIPPGLWTIVAAVWAGWVMRGLTQIAIAFMHVRRARNETIPFPVDREAQLVHWTALCHRGRRTRLVVSSHVHRAAVLGFDRSVIAVAPETMARLTNGELDQIVVHEYAHVQRRDDLAIVLQRVIMAVAGIHPAVWWLDRAVSIEREVACDDWVVAQTGSVKRYASCLIDLAESVTTNAWAVSPGAAFSRVQLAIRIRRLLDWSRNASTSRSRATLWLAQPAVIGATLACAALPLVGVASWQPYSAPGAATPETSVARSISGALTAQTIAPPTPSIGVVTQHRPVFVRRQPPTAVSDSIAARVPDTPIDRPPSLSFGAPRRSSPTLRASVGGFEPISLPTTPVMAAENDHVGDLPVESPNLSRSPIAATPIAVAIGESPRTERAGENPSSQEPIWEQAAAVGVAIGRGSRQAGVNAGAFFSRLGKSVASSF